MFDIDPILNVISDREALTLLYQLRLVRQSNRRLRGSEKFNGRINANNCNGYSGNCVIIHAGRNLWCCTTLINPFSHAYIL